MLVYTLIALFWFLAAFGIVAVNTTCCWCDDMIMMLLAFVTLILSVFFVAFSMVLSVGLADVCYFGTSPSRVVAWRRAALSRGVVARRSLAWRRRVASSRWRRCAVSSRMASPRGVVAWRRPLAH